MVFIWGGGGYLWSSEIISWGVRLELRGFRFLGSVPEPLLGAGQEGKFIGRFLSKKCLAGDHHSSPAPQLEGGLPLGSRSRPWSVLTK